MKTNKVAFQQVSGLSFTAFGTRGWKVPARLVIKGSPGPMYPKVSVRFRVELNQAEVDFAVADLASAVGLKVVTPIERPAGQRLQFLVDSMGTLYMQLDLLDLGREFARLVVPVPKDSAVALLHRIAHVLEWDLYDD